MAKKAQAKAAKKPVKKAAVKVAKAAVEELNSASDTPVQNVQVEPGAVTSVQVQAEPVQEVSISAEEKKEESKMTDGDKGIGKAYNPAEFSQPATASASGGSSKIFLYAGIGVGVLAVIVVGLFFIGGFGSTGESNVTGATVITTHCSDTDGGYNRFTKGVAEGTYYLDYNEGTYMDECSAGEENKLTEYYCKGDLVVYATEPCAEGMTCQDGVCVSQ